MTQIQIPKGTVVHTEFASKDPEATCKWFTDVFGTRFHNMGNDQGDYFTFGDPDVGLGGAVRPLMAEDVGGAPYSCPYLSTDDIDATIGAAEAAGAQVMVPKQPVEKMGWFAWFTVPGGCIVATWQNDADAPAAQA